MDHITHYYAYLLRLWQTGLPEQPTWRASLEDPHTRQVTGFSSLEALCEYLLQFNRKEESNENSPGVEVS